MLERAVKEQERREGHKEGFSTSPADCLAYKYYRDVSLPSVVARNIPDSLFPILAPLFTFPKAKHAQEAEQWLGTL